MDQEISSSKNNFPSAQQEVAVPTDTPFEKSLTTKKKIRKVRNLPKTLSNPIKMKVPITSDLSLITTVKPQNKKQNILSTVYSYMNKLTPSKYNTAPTTFSSTVDHLKIAMTFMLYSNFKFFISKFLHNFKFERHGLDITRVVATNGI
eukprot:TRINITY_DN5602_c0_g2_i2.p1 TRINITY_DN5602_c0_g2~~TRINITY_DN5602_c0_g2_i2.p1  ORF type:complete len:148 (-),score=29.39 TRINITY_DN5602_c0_g2_i2:1419-1862(-)